MTGISDCDGPRDVMVLSDWLRTGCACALHQKTIDKAGRGHGGPVLVGGE